MCTQENYLWKETGHLEGSSLLEMKKLINSSLLNVSGRPINREIDRFIFNIHGRPIVINEMGPAHGEDQTWVLSNL